MSHTILPEEKVLEEARPIIDETLAACETMLAAHGDFRISLTQTESEFLRDHMKGATGFTKDGGFIAIEIEPRAPEWHTGLTSKVAHEFNHLVWMREHNVDCYTLSVADLLVLEGLGQCFEEAYMEETPPHARAISHEQAAELWQTVREHLSEPSEEWHYYVWFGKDPYPHWGGYTVSYLLAKHVIERTEHTSWRELIRKRSDAWIEEGREIFEQGS